MKSIQSNNISWVNLSNPNFDDLNFLEKEMNLGQTVLKELAGFNKRAQIDEYNDYIFLVIHFPVFNEKNCQTIPTEIDFIITKDKIVSVYQQLNPKLENLFDELQENLVLQKDYFKSSGHLLFCILDHLIDHCLPMLDHIHEKIEDVERHVFEGKEREMLKEIAILKRDIIDFRRTIKPQRSVLEILAKKAGRFFKHEELDIIAQEVIGSEIRVWNTLENHKEMIEAIEKTNESLLSYQINQVMRALTFFSIILFSLTFIASFFSMKIMENFLFIKDKAGIYVVGGIMAIIVLIIVILFKKKKWM